MEITDNSRQGGSDDVQIVSCSSLPLAAPAPSLLQLWVRSTGLPTPKGDLPQPWGQAADESSPGQGNGDRTVSCLDTPTFRYQGAPKIGATWGAVKRSCKTGQAQREEP